MVTIGNLDISGVPVMTSTEAKAYVEEFNRRREDSRYVVDVEEARNCPEETRYAYPKESKMPCYITTSTEGIKLVVQIINGGGGGRVSFPHDQGDFSNAWFEHAIHARIEE